MPYFHGSNVGIYHGSYSRPPPPAYPPRRPPLTPTPNHLPYDDVNPNLVPLGPRRGRTPTPAPSPVPSVTASEDEDLPQLWDPALSSLMNRTLRAYDLVTNYARDCPSGTRWTTKDIAELRTEGIHLHNDVRALRDWQRKAAEVGDLGEGTMNSIHDEAEEVRGLCVHVLRWIVNTERVPRGQPSVPSPTIQTEGGEQRDGGRGRESAHALPRLPQAESVNAHVHARLPVPLHYLDSAAALAPLRHGRKKKLVGGTVGSDMEMEMEMCTAPTMSTDLDKREEEEEDLIDVALRADWGTTSSITRKSVW